MPSRPSDTPAGFTGLGLTDSLVAAVTALGYEEATPVQRETIPSTRSRKPVRITIPITSPR